MILFKIFNVLFSYHKTKLHKIKNLDELPSYFYALAIKWVKLSYINSTSIYF